MDSLVELDRVTRQLGYIPEFLPGLGNGLKFNAFVIVAALLLGYLR